MKSKQFLVQKERGRLLPVHYEMIENYRRIMMPNKITPEELDQMEQRHTGIEECDHFEEGDCDYCYNETYEIKKDYPRLIARVRELEGEGYEK